GRATRLTRWFDLSPRCSLFCSPGTMLCGSYRRCTGEALERACDLDCGRPVVLSDRSIKSEIAAGRILIEPFDESLVQPSSVDVRVDRKFRVFHNARYPYIDVRKPMDDLTELVEIDDEGPFVLHPGEFVLGQTLETITL